MCVPQGFPCFCSAYLTVYPPSRALLPILTVTTKSLLFVRTWYIGVAHTSWGPAAFSSKTCPQDDRYESCPDSLVGALHLLCLTPHIYTVRPKTAFTCITVFYMQTCGVSQTLLERHHLYCGVTLSPLLIAIELCCLEDMIGAPTAMGHIYWTWSHG